jgi:hypothetical protein
MSSGAHALLYDLYFRATASARQARLPPEPMSNMLNYAHNLAMTDVKHDRMNGKLWSFPCTARVARSW